MKVRKQNELLAGGFKLSPENQIQLEFYVRDQIEKKKEVMKLLEDLMTTIKSQSEIASMNLDAYKSFTEGGKASDSIKEKLQDSQLQLKALALLKMDPAKAKRMQELFAEFAQ